MKTDTGCDLKKKLFNQQNTFRPCSGIQTALVTIFAHLCKFQTKNRKRMINISRRNENKNVSYNLAIKNLIIKWNRTQLTRLEWRLR